MSNQATSIRRAYLTVGTRQVHYRRAGSGSPVILLHESPRSSLAMRWLIEPLAEHFCVIALDTPGYGGSDPLSVKDPEAGHYADAVAETISALGLESVAVYGSHTGACIALEFARRHGGRVSALVLDGVPIYTDAERAERLAHYTPSFEPRIDGAHMTAMWTRQRDQYLFYPWYRREAATRRHISLPSAQALHEGVMDVLRAGSGYGKAYAAAFNHRPEPLLRELSVPTLVLLREADVLAAASSRMPELPACASFERISSEPARVASRVESFLAAHVDGPAAPGVPRPGRIAGRITRDYADTSWGQLLVRHAGDDDAPPLVMLHASPSSAEMLVGLIEQVAERGRRVVAFDTLGNGESDKPPWQVAEIPDYAPVVAQALEALGEQTFDLYGNHTGAHIATEVALLVPDRVRMLVIEGVAMFEPEYADYLLENYTPALEPRDDGTHLLWAWNFVRDQTLFWPWFNRTREGIREVEPVEAAALHRLYVEVLKSGHTYPIGYRAAFRHVMCERLPELRTPTLMIATEADMLHDATIAAAKLAPNASAETVTRDPGATAQVIVDFLATASRPAHAQSD